MFFVPLQVDPDDNTKLRDGPETIIEEPIKDARNIDIGAISITSPVWMLDGDIEYTFTIGSPQSILYNFVYIIDTSSSVRGNAFKAAKDAYVGLTQFLVTSGIANRSRFSIIPFSNSASASGVVTASQAISIIQGLNAFGGTNFNAALGKAAEFLSELPDTESGTSNIAYFLSDGNPNRGGDNFSENATSLQNISR